MDHLEPPTRRLFVALNLPPATRAELVRRCRPLRELPGIRLTPPGNLHITACFIGAVSPEAAPELCARLFDAMRGPPHRLAVGPLVARPGPRSARLLAFEVSDLTGRLAAQVVRISDVVARFAPDRAPQPFWPHVTVARFSRPTGVRRYAQPRHEHVFDIDRISLYHSDSTENGPPHYRPLMTVPLATGP